MNIEVRCENCHLKPKGENVLRRWIDDRWLCSRCINLEGLYHPKMKPNKKYWKELEKLKEKRDGK